MNTVPNNIVNVQFPNLTLPPSGIKEAIVMCFAANLVPLVTSSPGLGKTEIAGEIANDYRLKLIDFRLAQADITDLNGLPKFIIDAKGRERAVFIPFDIFPLEDDELPDHPDGGKYDGWLLLMDELTSAPKQLQAAGYKLILERMVGNHKIHDRCMMMGAGNLASDKAVVHAMSTALQSRLIHIEMRVDHSEWMIWAHRNQIDSRIIGFLEFKQDYLHHFNPDHEDKTFACPRTWWFTHKLIKNIPLLEQKHVPILAGTVSAGVAMEFVQFCRIYLELPKIKDIITIPESCQIPDEPSTKYAMTTVLTDYITDKNAEQIVKYLKRFPVEFHVVTLRMIRLRNNKLMRNPFIQELFRSLGKLAE